MIFWLFCAPRRDHVQRACTPRWPDALVRQLPVAALEAGHWPEVRREGAERGPLFPRRLPAGRAPAAAGWGGVGPGGSSSGRPPRVPQAPPPQQDGDPQGCGCAPRSLGHASSSEGRTPAAGRLYPIRRSPGPSDQLSIMHTVHPAPRPGPQRPVSHTHASSLQLHFIRCNILSTGPTPPHLLRLWAQRW